MSTGYERNVSIVKSTYSDLYLKLQELLNLCGGLKIKNDEKVVIKINLCDFRPPETGAITHPVFLDYLLEYLRKNFRDLRVYVVESDATLARPDMFIRWFNFLPIFKKWGAIWCNLSKQEKIFKEIDGYHFRRLGVPRIFEDAYFISLAKMKTHISTKISCVLKNQFGCIPYRRKIKFHPHLDDVIVDANLAMRPDFSIVDGIIGLGGRGPTFGIPIHAKVVVAGADPVAVDAVCATIMGLNAKRIRHVQKATKAGIGLVHSVLSGLKLDEAKTDFRFNVLDSYVLRIGDRFEKLFSK